jgi:hypothetical protein
LNDHGFGGDFFGKMVGGLSVLRMKLLQDKGTPTSMGEFAKWGNFWLMKRGIMGKGL